MSKCNKAKNPCKICLTPVTQKTGLQCQGACQSWVHYACLNYTPGKIKDIKAGIIKVTCPCPDCKTSLPKEFRTDQPFSCNNSMCPANQPPKCDNYECPTNRNRQAIPTLPPCPLSKCGNQCKQFSSPHLPQSAPQSASNKPCAPPPETPAAESSDACLGSSKPKCPSGCSSTNDVSGDNGAKGGGGCGGSGGGGGGGGGSSMPPAPNFDVVEQMCNTVGELTNQIKELMCQMKQAANRGGGGGGSAAPARKSCPAQGNKESCPKPCYCPGNPARRT